MLIDKHDGYIFPFLCEAIERSLDRLVVRFVVHNQKVLL